MSQLVVFLGKIPDHRLGDIVAAIVHDNDVKIDTFCLLDYGMDAVFGNQGTVVNGNNDAGVVFSSAIVPLLQIDPWDQMLV